MMVRMLVTYGKLRRNEWYPVDASGPDWYRIGGLYVSKDFTTTEREKVRRTRRVRQD